MKTVIELIGCYPFPEPKTLGEKVKKYRYINGLTLEEFGTMVGVDGATVWTWENGVYVPSSETVIKIDLIIELPVP